MRLRVKAGGIEKVCRFFVVPNHCRPILGLPDLLRMDMVQFKVPTTNQWSDHVGSVESNMPGLTKEQILSEYQDVFTGLGRLKVDPIKIHLTQGAKPCRRPCRRVPIAMRQKFKDELDSLEDKDVLRKLKPNEVPEWLNSFVCPVKDDGGLRVCLDPTGLNPYIIRPVFNSHTLDEISYKLKDGKVLTVCDANKGFFQVPLHPDSQLLTAMLTPEGIYVHNVLAMELSLASDVFEQIIRDLTKDLNGVLNIADDLLVYGSTIEEHDNNLKALLNRCRDVNLTLNPKKLRFKSENVPFFGNIVTSKGIKPDPKKVEAIKAWPTPTNVKELQSFLGAVNYLSKYIPHLSTLRSTLQCLIKKDTEYLWTPTHDRAFQDIKDAICTETLLSYFDKSKPVFIEVDASGQGLGAALLQGNIEEFELQNASQTEGKFLEFRNRLKPIAFASKSLSEAETRYSNIERELLGVVWAVDHFNHYTFANKIHIISDHKPLQPLFNGKMLVTCSPRTARLLLKIIDKDIKFYYQNGPTMHISDALSRLSSHNTKRGNAQEVKGLNIQICEVCPVQSNLTINQVQAETAKDQDMQQLITYIIQGWPAKQQECIQQLQSYHTFKEEMSVVDGLIFKGERLIIPQSLKHKALQAIHRSHMGIQKTLDRSKGCFYWPGISKDITNVCETCEECLKFGKRQQKEPKGQVRDASEAWESLATDIFEYKGKFFLIVSCRFSGFIVVRSMSSHSTAETIQQFQNIFSELGVPRHLHCDRGTNYTSIEFQKFMQGLNVQLSFSSSEHHSSNYAERSVQVVKGFMKKSAEWPICLLEYLMTPIRHQGVDSSSIKLMQRRTIRGILPVRQQESNLDDYNRYHARKAEQEQYQTGKILPQVAEGSSILFYSERESQWIPGVIVQRLHDRRYVIISEKGRKMVRNRIDIKPYHKDVHVRFQSVSNRSITSAKSSLSYPMAVEKTPAQPQTSHTSLQDPLDSSRPNNSNHQTPSLSSHKSSPQSSLYSSKIESSSQSFTKKPSSRSSLSRLSETNSNGRIAEGSGKIKPQVVQKSTISSHKSTINGQTSPPKTRSGRMVRKPERFKD